MNMFPRGTRHMAININDGPNGDVLDAILDGNAEGEVSINNSMVKYSDIQVLDIKFHFPYVLLLFCLKKDAVVEPAPAPVAEPAAAGPADERKFAGPTDAGSDPNASHEDRMKQISQQMSKEADAQQTATGPAEK